MRLVARSRGIVLKKHFPRRLALSLIDEQHGHIVVIPDGWQWASRLCPGALVAYELFVDRNIFFIRQSLLEAVPAYSSELVMLFGHHLLELCSLCLPLHDPHAECFALLEQCMNSLDQLATDSYMQKIVVAKLLVVLGQPVCSEIPFRMISILYQPYSHLVSMVLDEDQQRELDLFIYQCIYNHPYGRLLKTVHFLSRVGSQ